MDRVKLLDLIQNQRYAVEYQPIVAICADKDAGEGAELDETVIGYEALARFLDDQGNKIPPDQVFRALHDDHLSLYQVEYCMKRLQIAKSPKDCLLFLNLDQDAFDVFGDSADNPFLDLISQRSNMVIEMIENSNIVDACISSRMAECFASKGVQLALDDIGAPNSLLAVDVLARVNYMKLAREWLQLCEDPIHRCLLESLLTFARASNKKTILEGVETPEHLAFARELRVDYVQGFYYREQFIYREMNSLSQVA